MGLMSEILSEAHAEAITKIRDRYLADPDISEETKEVLKRMSAEMIYAVGD